MPFSIDVGTNFHTHTLQLQSSNQNSYVWMSNKIKSFDELLISWNACRPTRGHFVILSRVLIGNQWTPWLLYAVWGSFEQYSFHESTSLAPVRSFQDQVELLDHTTATAFSIRIEACQGASLSCFLHLYVCASKLNLHQIWKSPQPSFISLKVPNTAQLNLAHPRAHSLCSPTSTTAVIQSIQGNQKINPIDFARKVYDAGFDIYGNWAFNVAQAFVELGYRWQCFCIRLENIQTLWGSLKKHIPVVISIKGTLPGSILPYEKGHLIVIKGFDPNKNEFLCMDPAFHSNEQTEITYPFDLLMLAWKKRNYLSYIFSQNLNHKIST